MIQMRLHLGRRCPAQRRRNIRIQALCDGPGIAARERFQDLCLAHAAMRKQFAQPSLRLHDGRTMGGIENRVAARDQFIQAGKIGRHVAIGRRHHAGRPAHHMIAAEQGAFFFQRVTYVIGGMARRGDAGQGEAIASEHVAIGNHDVRREIAVRAFLHLAGRLAMRSGSVSAGAAPLLEGGGRGRMIAVGVCDQDVADLACADRAFQRRDVIGKIGTRIDHGHAVRVDHMNAGSLEGERPGIGRQQADYPRRQAHRLAIRRFQRTVEVQRNT
ncbi:MAG: hypothetical protein RJB58_1949 [Pseudomonadota bacterium]